MNLCASLLAVATPFVFAAFLPGCGGSTDDGSTVSIVKSITVVEGQATTGGTVVSIPAGIDCTIAADTSLSGRCTASFPHDTQVTLTATPAAAGIFDHWTNLGSGEDFDYEAEAVFTMAAGGESTYNPLAFSVDANRTLAIAVDFSPAP